MIIDFIPLDPPRIAESESVSVIHSEYRADILDIQETMMLAEELLPEKAAWKSAQIIPGS